MRSRRPLSLAAFGTATLAMIVASPTAGALGFGAASQAVASDGIGTDNFPLVKNVPHSEGGRGSDIEFATFTYPDAATAQLAGFTVDPAADALPGEPGIQKDIAIAGTTGTRMYLYDITDPANTYETAAYDCAANQGDSQIFRRTDADGTVRTYSTYTVEDSSASRAEGSTCYEDANVWDKDNPTASGTFIIEITDPFNPVAVAHITVPEGSHNGTVHPSGNYFYNSNSSLYTDTAFDGGAGIEYYDISDFDNIQRLGRLMLPPIPASLGTESHDITFNADGSRAYSAALSQGVIINTEDPANPQIITNFVDPTIQVWHQSDPITLDAGTPDDPSDDRTLLVVEDEVAGAIGTGQCPNGGVHVFDITGPLENAPVKLGYWNIDEARVMAVDGSASATYSCTAHVFRLYPDAGVMTIAYYNGGTRVVDLNGLVGIGLGDAAVVDSPISDSPMQQIAFRRFANSDEWAAKSPRITRNADGTLAPFHVFANGSRGLDVLAYTGGVDADAARASNWMTPDEAAQALPRLTVAELTANLQANSEYVCFLS